MQEYVHSFFRDTLFCKFPDLYGAWRISVEFKTAHYVSVHHDNTDETTSVRTWSNTFPMQRKHGKRYGAMLQNTILYPMINYSFRLKPRSRIHKSLSAS